MKKIISYVLFVLFVIFILVSNFTYFNVYLPQCYPYRYCTDKCRFDVNEIGKGHDPFGSVELSFEKYKSDVQNPDLVLHRRFYRKWWQIWNWYDFLTHKRWSYPYAENDEDT